MEFKKRPLYKRDYEADKVFDHTRRKYATVIIFLLVNNVQASELGAYFIDPKN